MRMFICTLLCKQTLRIRRALVSAFLSAAFLSLPSFAQDARTGNSAEARLRISVNVVSTVSPRGQHKDKDKDKDREGDSVSYNMAPHDQELSVTRELRSMLVEGQGSGGQNRQVELTTVVAK